MHPRTAPRLTYSDRESLYRAPQPHDSRRVCASLRLQPPSTDDELLVKRKHRHDDNLDALQVHRATDGSRRATASRRPMHVLSRATRRPARRPRIAHQGTEQKCPSTGGIGQESSGRQHDRGDTARRRRDAHILGDSSGTWVGLHGQSWRHCLIPSGRTMTVQAGGPSPLH